MLSEYKMLMIDCDFKLYFQKYGCAFNQHIDLSTLINYSFSALWDKTDWWNMHSNQPAAAHFRSLNWNPPMRDDQASVFHLMNCSKMNYGHFIPVLATAWSEIVYGAWQPRTTSLRMMKNLLGQKNSNQYIFEKCFEQLCLIAS